MAIASKAAAAFPSDQDITDLLMACPDTDL
jgi:hypothetical protein